MDKNEQKKRAEIRHGHDYNYQLKIFVYGMPSSAIFVESVWLNDSLRDDSFHYYLSFAFSIFFYCMALYSYEQCVKLKNFTLPRSAPGTHLPDVLDPAYKNEKTCKTCNFWQPARALHCTSCGTCTPRHDHHCPWIFNCVGYQNHKAFFLFCTYLMFIIYLWENWDHADYSFLFYLYWIINTVVIFSTMFMFIGLSGFHFALALNNLTSSDNLSAYPLRFPCIPDAFYENKHSKVNIFDQGWISNLAHFFGNNIFTFWIPTEGHPLDDGNSFALNPPCFQTEFQEGEKEKSISEIVLDSDQFEVYIRDKYKENSFQVNNKIVEHWRKFDNK